MQILLPSGRFHTVSADDCRTVADSLASGSFMPTLFYETVRDLMLAGF